MTTQSPLLTWLPTGSKPLAENIVKPFVGKAKRLSIPMYYLNDVGEWIPIQKGFAIPQDRISELIDVLQQGLALMLEIQESK